MGRVKRKGPAQYHRSHDHHSSNIISDSERLAHERHCTKCSISVSLLNLHNHRDCESSLEKELVETQVYLSGPRAGILNAIESVFLLLPRLSCAINGQTQSVRALPLA